jgi:uncharacterized protein (DUF1501 family)
MTQNHTGQESGVSRRDFLRTSSAGLGAAGMGLAATPSLANTDHTRGPQGERRVILLFLNGGPSHLDTWDPKPDARSEIRGPFSAISTNVPGIQLIEHFPLMAARANQYALLRGVYHEESPIHETGHQLINTGFLFRGGIERPSVGSVVQQVRGSRAGNGYVVLGGRLGNTGVNVSHGQDAGGLGRQRDPDYLTASTVLSAEPTAAAERYGRTSFGQNCRAAARLVESGVDFVTVNMFETVFGQVSWDCHANGGDLSTTLEDYSQTVCPMFDRAYTALLDDLSERGLLASTLVLAVGEFGRTPRINARGGRDHWPGVWTAIAAGGDVQGGRVIGASDRQGTEPKDRPVHASELAATIYQHLGIDAAAKLNCGRHESLAIAQADPVAELTA